MVAATAASSGDITASIELAGWRCGKFTIGALIGRKTTSKGPNLLAIRHQRP
jgi:hypothetical protein